MYLKLSGPEHGVPSLGGEIAKGFPAANIRPAFQILKN